MENELPLRLPGPDDPEMMALVQRWVTPGRRYLQLLGGNFQREPASDREPFLSSLRADAAAVPSEDLRVLLDSEWRARLTASWLIATDRRPGFMDRLGELLLASELTYACQGFAFALARLGGSTASMHLCAYLDTWLPQLDKRYDQCWVLASLLYLDSLEGTDAGQAYLSSGAWDAWATWRGITQDVDECQVWIRGLADAIASG